MGNFGSDSTTKQLSVLTDNKISASDQAVVVANRFAAGSGGTGNYQPKLGKNASITTTVNNGLGQDDLTKFLTNIAGATGSGVGGWGSGSPGVDQAIDARVAGQVDAGGQLAKDNIQATGFVAAHQWLLLAIGGFAVLVAIVFAWRKKT